MSLICIKHRTTITNEDDDSDSEESKEDSDDERSENSDFETECYESYTSKITDNLTIIRQNYVYSYFWILNTREYFLVNFWFLGFCNKKKEPEVLVEGVDWESVNYQLNKLSCDEDEITGNVELICISNNAVTLKSV